MFIPTWIVIACLVLYVYSRYIENPRKIRKTRQNALDSITNPLWAEWKKQDDAMYEREGRRQWKREAPAQYLPPDVVKRLKAEIAARPAPKAEDYGPMYVSPRSGNGQSKTTPVTDFYKIHEI
jgi:hypothetical protein